MPVEKPRPGGSAPPNVAAQVAAWREERWKFQLAVSLTVAALPLALIGLTVSIVGFHRTPDIRAEDHWTAWLLVAVLSTGTVLGATALGSGLPWHPVRRGREIRFAAGYEPVRSAWFGPKTSWTIAVVPALGTLPVIFAETALLPLDPATGQAGVDVGAMTTGIILAVGVILLREYTGRNLTLLGLTAWSAWAGYTQDAQKPTAAWVGTAGIAAVLVALAGVVVDRRLLRLRG